MVGVLERRGIGGGGGIAGLGWGGLVSGGKIGEWGEGDWWVVRGDWWVVRERKERKGRGSEEESGRKEEK